MILAAVDTSHARGSLVVANSNKILSTRAWTKQAMHSEVATVEFENAIKESGLSLNQLTHLAVNVGPGSFTGVRVGISLMRTLSYALNLPIACVGTLELLAWRDGKGRTLVATKAVQNFFYAAVYENGKVVLEPTSTDDPDSLARTQGCGAVLVEGLTPGFIPWTEAKDVFGFLNAGDRSSRFFSWQSVKPLYVRASEAEEKLKRGLLKPWNPTS